MGPVGVGVGLIGGGRVGVTGGVLVGPAVGEGEGVGLGCGFSRSSFVLMENVMLMIDATRASSTRPMSPKTYFRSVRK